MTWTDENVKTLKRMWADGRSAAEISRLVDVTRNAVIGKVHRLDLGRDKASAMAKRNVRRMEEKTKRPHRMSARAAMAAADRGLSQRINNGPPSAVSFDAIPDAAADLTIPARQRKTIFELTADTCRWPVGTPGHPGFFFCGGATGGDLYCPAHACRAFNGFGGRRGAPLAAGFARDTR